MKAEDRTYEICQDGMPVSDLIRKSSINYINGLRENDLILITKKGNLRLTKKGRIAREMGLSCFLSLSETEKEILIRKSAEVRSENLGFKMALGGFVLSFVFILSYWFLKF